ncbi:FecR domain-containing protein [Brevundimonas sp. 3P9-tot-E]|uniref:FecR family protein n=1 Tax=Brevundimonas TaxID=41275 RepID=UPI0034D5B9A3
MSGLKSTASDLNESAVLWVLRVENGLSPVEAVELADWLAADAGRQAAFDAVRDAGLLLDRFAGEDVLIAMRGSALKARSEKRSFPTAVAATLAAVAILGGAGWWAAGGGLDFPTTLGAGVSTQRYVTAAGERATVTLSDGSLLTLNADSAVETAYDAHTRRITLVKGQAFFDVAHDPSRPFDVIAAGHRVTAVGTAFDVLVLPDALRVAMLDGVVRVSVGAEGAPQTLSAGEVMRAGRDGSVTVRTADIQRLAGWRDGVIFFEETPLLEAVAEMNRYARQRMVVADAEAGELRVSGAFRSSEADAFAEAMADVFDLSVRRSADGRTVISSKKT